MEVNSRAQTFTLEFPVSDILNVACYKTTDEPFSPMKQALLYWGGETMYI